MCQHCGWEKVALRAEDVAEALPEYMTRKQDFFESVAETILHHKHATPKQIEAIEEGEAQVELLEEERGLA